MEPDKSWLTDAAKCDCIQKKLSYFNSQHGNNSQHIDRVIKALSRGKALVQAAIEWQNPAIGQSQTPDGVTTPLKPIANKGLTDLW